MKQTTLATLLLVGMVFIAVWILADTVIQSRFSFHTDLLFVSQYGAFLAGLFTLLSAFLIWSSFTHQTASFEITQLENRWFKLIEIHRSNVSRARFMLPQFEQVTIELSDRAFMEIQRQVLHAKQTIEQYANTNSIKLSKQARLAEADPARLRGLKRLDEFHAISIAYLVTFFGVGSEGIESLRRILEREYSRKFTTLLLRTLARKYSAYNGRTKYYGGHQNILGNYFRHIFQSLTYLNDNRTLDYKKKYGYAKIYRAQLTTYEQALLFFDSVSPIGRAWELVPKIVHANINASNYGLITKYNLIKNIPAEFLLDIKVSLYYPLVEYEGFESPSGRPELEKGFK